MALFQDNSRPPKDKKPQTNLFNAPQAHCDGVHPVGGYRCESEYNHAGPHMAFLFNGTCTWKDPESLMLKAALLYAKQFLFAVFPVSGKVPYKGTYGFKDASRDPVIIQRIAPIICASICCGYHITYMYSFIYSHFASPTLGLAQPFRTRCSLYCSSKFIQHSGQ